MKWQALLEEKNLQFKIDYNINPQANVLALRENDNLDYLHWSLIPFWSKTVKLKYSLFNARIEGIESKPSFREAFKKRHALIPANSYFEWREENGHKRPYNIALPDHETFCFAGLWEHWQQGDSEITSCTIITTEAIVKMQSLHQRMPLIINPKNYERWLDVDHLSAEESLELLRDNSVYEDISFYPVSTLVSNPRNNDPQCIEPLSA
jgi:putative SOS response-associated peptidase YedK